jgi:divalent metal cation (Fe/Co/Zn/Cd) transporter
MMDVAGEMQSSRIRNLKIGVRLAVATVVWNLAEGVIAVCAGVFARSIAPVAFGMDSFIETTSGALLGWRLVSELRNDSGEQAANIERRMLRVAGGLLLLLAAYIMIDAGARLFGYGAEPRPSEIGIIVTAAALVAMPVLALLKFRTACALRAEHFEPMRVLRWLSGAIRNYACL